MWLRILSAATVGLVLSACQAIQMAGSGSGMMTRPDTRTNATVLGSASTAPGKLALLAKPSSASQVLSGVLQLDATYLISHDGGSLISHDGGSLISHDGGSLISHDGGSAIAVVAGALISHDGGSLISHDGGSVIAAASGNLIVPNDVLASDGVQPRAALISHDGGSLISHDGGSLISHDGGSLSAGAAAGWRVLDTSAKAASVQLPAAGMWIRAISLKDNTALPLGVDGSGNPVYVVATDASGHFTVYLPADVAENVRIVASVPHSDDARVLYNHVVAPTAGSSLTLDEDHALVSSLMRDAMHARLAEAFASTGSAGATAGIAAGLPGIPAATIDAYNHLGSNAQLHVIQLAADQALSTLDLTGKGVITTDDFAALNSAFHDVSGQIDTLLSGTRGEAGFMTRPWVAVGQLRRQAAHLPPVRFLKPSDVAQFIIDQYLGTGDPQRAAELTAALTDLGLDAAHIQTIQQVTTKVETTLATQLMAHPEVISAAVDAQKNAPAPATPAPADPSPLPLAVPAPGSTAGVVTTYANTGFGQLLASAIDAQHRLFVSLPTSLVAMIDLNDPSHATTSFAGTIGQFGSLDGPAASATFGSPSGLACDGTHLYVAETPFDGQGLQPGGRIRMIDLVDPAHPVTTIAGSATAAGDADGPGLQARFRQVNALALDPHGDLVVADIGNQLVRKIDLHDASHPVTTVLGVRGQTASALLDGPAASTPLQRLAGLTYDGKGGLVVVDGNAIRRLGADGILRVVAGGPAAGLADGYWMDAGLNAPIGLATLPSGDVLICDSGSHRLRRMRLDTAGLGATVWTVAGAPVQSSDPDAGQSVDGTGAAASFRWFLSCAVDPQGAVYIPEQRGGLVRKVVLPD